VTDPGGAVVTGASVEVTNGAEFLNIFNHANFDVPQGDIINSSFGFSTSANDPRIGQLAIKFEF
jgi:hypothetical protein